MYVGKLSIGHMYAGFAEETISKEIVDCISQSPDCFLHAVYRCSSRLQCIISNVYLGQCNFIRFASFITIFLGLFVVAISLYHCFFPFVKTKYSEGISF